ncbi:GntR family transcriptional regulator [Sphingomonas sp. BK580]|uniref:GntR family transcriptional regulator n=1 Tax=Sphingomonas sp. BK580 TaxID=2586972 RepID=UPI001608AFE7|nr:GntR family transcriptional regulator [Sphingomonas sp. BK580]MBB3695250.1 DNA-binding GntR family transcriptional regulator [Sphingomonas sp. BK580]
MPAKPVTGELEFTTRSQAAAQALREAIISGELVQGDRLLEQHWSKRLGIGQPTLREAMRELEYQGLLRRTHQRGTYVAELSPDDYRQILEVRIPLEARAMGLASERLTPELAKELIDIVATMADTERDEDVRRFHDCDVMFHRRIWDAAGNPYLRALLESITFRLFVFSVVGRWPESPNTLTERRAAIRQHQGILDGILSRDPRQARRAFVDQTVNYWNEQYGLDLRLSD